MGKITIADIARSLAEKNNLQPHDAEAFVADLFETIKQGLDSDKQVKVKGLGTFKTVDVEARQSVSVNTGERVVIDGHVKVGFTPDASMKELVNKPFSQFETVILNEGVDFDEQEQVVEPEPVVVPEPETVVENTPEPVVEPEPAPVVEAPVVEPEPESVVEEVQNIVEEQIIEPEPLVEETPVEVSEEQVVEEESEPEPEPEPQPEVESEPDEEEEEESEEKSSFWRILLMILKILLVIVFAFAIGYGVGKVIGYYENASEYKSVVVHSDGPTTVNLIVADPSKVDTTMIGSDSLFTDTLKADSLKADTLKEQKKDTIAAAKPAVSEPEYLKYNEMDKRLRLGAYYIMGTKTIHIVNTGQSLRRITRRWLGDEELMCYIEVYNGITANDTLTKGQEIKIPLLKTKKYVNRVNREKAKDAAKN